MVASELTPARGIVRLRRSQLEALAGAESDALDTGTDVGRDLADLGVVADGRIDPVMADILAALRSPRSRFGLRTQTPADLRLHRGWIGGIGVITVSSTTRTDTTAMEDPVLDIQMSPRRSSVARVLSRLLDLGHTAPTGHPPASPTSWREITQGVMSPSAEWVVDLFGPDAQPVIHHLRWTDVPTQPARTSLLLITAGGRGIVKVVPTDEGYNVEATSSLTVWTALCGLLR